MDSPQMELSLILPCLNEERTVGICVAKAINFLKENNIHGEVLVADNGSTPRMYTHISFRDISSRFLLTNS